MAFGAGGPLANSSSALRSVRGQSSNDEQLTPFLVYPYMYRVTTFYSRSAQLEINLLLNYDRDIRQSSKVN